MGRVTAISRFCFVSILIDRQFSLAIRGHSCNVFLRLGVVGEIVAIRIIKKLKTALPHSLMLLKGMNPAKGAEASPSSSKLKVANSATKGAKPIRQDKSERHERLRKLILQTIDGSLSGGMAFEFEGFVWAVRPEPEWAKLLGVKSADTISDLIKIPPIQKDYTQVEGKKALLLRVGPPGVPTPRKIANFMRGAFRAKTGRYPKKEVFLLDVAQARCEAEIEPNCEPDRVRRKPVALEGKALHHRLSNRRTVGSGDKLALD